MLKSFTKAFVSRVLRPLFKSNKMLNNDASSSSSSSSQISSSTILERNHLTQGTEVEQQESSKNLEDIQNQHDVHIVNDSEVSEIVEQAEPQPLNDAKRQRSSLAKPASDSPPTLKRAKSENGRCPNLGQLPPCILARIFRMSSQRARMNIFPKVCKHWQHVAYSSAWDHFRCPLAYIQTSYLKDQQREIQNWIVERARNMRHVSFTDYCWTEEESERDYELFTAIIESASQLESVELAAAEGTRISKQLGMIVERGPMLRQIELGFVGVRLDSAEFSKALMGLVGFKNTLQRLSIQFSGVISNDFMYDTLPQLTSLTSLRFQGVLDLKLGENIHRLSNLKQVEIISCQVSVLNESVSKLPSLQGARFDHSSFLQDVSLYNVLLSPTLKELSLSACKVNVLAKYTMVAPIETLNLSNCALEWLPGSFSYLTHLKSIDLSMNFLSIFPRPLLKLQNLRFVDMSRQYSPGLLCKEALTWGMNIPECVEVRIDQPELNASLQLDELNQQVCEHQEEQIVAQTLIEEVDEQLMGQEDQQGEQDVEEGGEDDENTIYSSGDEEEVEEEEEGEEAKSYVEDVEEGMDDNEEMMQQDEIESDEQEMVVDC
eukprot:TRINITY_DN4068_c1_g2_i10.p1 TRINITY_DN4068_c1_g2~~TRINITY_DN4068_c1_g2_i10.p1  ORF type:complete len:603 (+),score=103.13 TRINITY_DN4068_c1_g2_i10:964-2772(+)